MKNCLAVLVVCLLSSAAGWAQSGNSEAFVYDREVVWGVNKNTNGGHIGAVNLKFSRRINEKTFRSLGLELANVKHPQEFRRPGLQGGSFIVGKTNYLYSIRGSYGFERVLSKKEPQQGIQIAVLASGGPTIGLEAPYYIEVAEGRNQNFVSRPARAVETTGNILGTGRPLQGITESQVVPGLHLRAGLSFEYGTFRTNVSGLEVGAMLEAFTRTIVLVPNATKPNRAIYPSVYATLYFGSRR